MKRTPNNDLILNKRGLSILNLIVILSAVLFLLFFLPIVTVWVPVYENRYFPFSVSIPGLQSLEGTLGGFDNLTVLRQAPGALTSLSRIFWLFLLLPLANIILWLLNQRTVGKRSYLYVHGIYAVSLSVGLVALVLLTILVRTLGAANALILSAMGYPALQGGGFVRSTLYLHLSYVLYLAVFILALVGVLRTGSLEIDEGARAADINVEYARNLWNATAQNIQSTVQKFGMSSSQTVSCPECGHSSSLSADFCSKCGHSLEEAKKTKAESQERIPRKEEQTSESPSIAPVSLEKENAAGELIEERDKDPEDGKDQPGT